MKDSLKVCGAGTAYGEFRKILLEAVYDGPVLLAHIKRDEVPRHVVPRSPTRGNGCVRDPRLEGSVVRGSTWWVLPLDRIFGLTLVVASERLTGRVGGF